MSNQPIQFLLHQLTTNEQDRENANLILPTKIRCHLSLDDGSLEFGNAYNSSQPFDSLEEIYQEKIIRTCLSRVNCEAVLGVFEGSTKYWLNYETGDYIIQDSQLPRPKGYKMENIVYKIKALYEVFDFPLRNGKPFDEGQALHEKMLDLVPEYKEFLNNNK
jgi:hypothetical protein